MRFIKKLYIYPLYNYTSDSDLWDVALIHLNKPVKYTMYTSPICIDETDLFFKESRCTASGWGSLEQAEDSPGSNVPHSVILTIMTQENCNITVSNFEPSFSIQPPLVCAIGEDQDGNGIIQDVCWGDSGGPLMCEVSGRWYQVGIVASGNVCGTPGYPGLYSRVTFYKYWIKHTMASGETNG
ncbi:testisin-like [Physella acuta]|uniref:testisin-like n=1 Tax=Physella acuta TaxID=109671 RepID=UPI0027DAD681|nr:testisin-like [Physella acuta]